MTEQTATTTTVDSTIYHEVDDDLSQGGFIGDDPDDLRVGSSLEIFESPSRGLRVASCCLRTMANGKNITSFCCPII